jgi:hypothetical protein
MPVMSPPGTVSIILPISGLVLIPPDSKVSSVSAYKGTSTILPANLLLGGAVVVELELVELEDELLDVEVEVDVVELELL